MLGLCLSPTRTARAALLGRWAWSTTVEMPELGAAVALAAAAADVTAAVAAAPTVAWQAPIFGSGRQLEESEEPCGAARLHDCTSTGCGLQPSRGGRPMVGRLGRAVLAAPRFASRVWQGCYLFEMSGDFGGDFGDFGDFGGAMGGAMGGAVDGAARRVWG